MIDCRHFGPPTGQTCKTCGGQQPTFHCRALLKPVTEAYCLYRCKRREPITMRHQDVTPDTPIDEVKRLLRQPPGAWPRKFEGYPNIAEGVKQLFAEAQQNIPPAPQFPIERGIVICGGGWRFFPSVYVTVRIIRHTGCQLPISVWYLGDRGEFDPRMAETLREYGVGWIDGNAAWRDRRGLAIRRANLDQPGTEAGWAMKPFAAAFAPFREVIFLDADCYPVYDPCEFMAHPEFQRVGAAFWPDRAPLEVGQYARFGVDVLPKDCHGFESGQFIVDKGRHWGPLWLTCWLNAYSEYTYRHMYGDKDTFNVAWHALGKEYCLPTRRPGWARHSFTHRDFAGRILFVHRTQDKFKMFGEMDGQAIPVHYSTRQQGRDQHNIVEPSLPLETEAHAFAARCDELLRPERHFDLYNSPHHLATWNAVNRANSEYRFGTYSPADVALDIGAHVGAATHALLTRGAGHVVAVEPLDENCRALRKNLMRWERQWSLLQAAVWRDDAPITLFPVMDGDATVRTAFRPAGPELSAPTMTLDAVISLALGLARHGRIRLLKIDVEGAEFPALYASQLLERVDEIVGEWHDQHDPGKHAKEGEPPFTGEALLGFLTDRGFQVETWNVKPADGMGIFRARRTS